MISDLEVTHSELFYSDQLARGLYKDKAASANEIFRNHCVGCMSDPRRWDPAPVYVEIQLITDWAPGPAVEWAPAPGVPSLLFFDRGHGFRDEDFKRFGKVGREDSSEGEFGGTSQKRMGRFAGLGLNEKSEKDPRSGYMVYTRTAEAGPVIAMEATPLAFAKNRLPRREIPPDSPELGPYRGVKGSFTLTVIPNSVFKTHEEIAECLKWYLPRKQDRAIKVLVGGKPLAAPPLAKEVLIHGGIEAHLEKHAVTGRDGPRGGIWLCDAESGLRCAYLPAMSQYVPWPMAKESLDGDIFARDLYKNQDTARSGLRHEFFKSKAWKNVLSVLHLKVAPFARDLLDLEEETFGDGAGLDRTVQDLADLLSQCWGPADKGGPGVWEVAGGVVVPPTAGGGGHSDGPHTPRIKPENPPPQRPRRAAIPVNIDGKTYYLAKMRLDEDVFAQLAGDGMTININPAYASLPSKGGARMEHTILGVFRAIADQEFYGDAKKASKRVAKLRADLKKSPKKPRAAGEQPSEPAIVH